MIFETNNPGGKTQLQNVSALVEWYLLDKQIELRFILNPTINYRQPEFFFEYWSDGRRITERVLAMMIVTDLSERNYNYTLGRIISALNTLSWKNYVANFEYPQWIADRAAPVLKRPPGRPRVRPPAIKFPATASNNTTADDIATDEPNIVTEELNIATEEYIKQ